jgi:ABC-type sugar transport system ATPase subunit
MIAELEMPTAGRIVLDGKDVTALRASSATSPSCSAVRAVPHMNVAQLSTR